MKKLNPTAFVSVFLLLAILFSGCATHGILAIGSDKTLPTINQVRYIVDKSSVGFEWNAIKDARVKGIKVYRAIPQNTADQRYTKIATIDDRYATHFVDTSVKPNQTYLYTFTTYGLLHESLPGSILKVSTRSAFKPVELIKVYMSDVGVVKVLWTPHQNPAISGYIIERKIHAGKWKYLAQVRGRLMPEFIDKSAAIGHEYSYRVVAKSSAGVRSIASNPISLQIR